MSRCRVCRPHLLHPHLHPGVAGCMHMGMAGSICILCLYCMSVSETIMVLLLQHLLLLLCMLQPSQLLQLHMLLLLRS